jgi:hypothetical protein
MTEQDSFWENVIFTKRFLILSINSCSRFHFPSQFSVSSHQNLVLYIASVKTASHKERNPRAPNLYSKPFLLWSLKLSSLIVNSTSSIRNISCIVWSKHFLAVSKYLRFLCLMDPYESTLANDQWFRNQLLDIFRNDVLQQIIFINIIYVFEVE